jgi:RNA polymerase sigma-70 factor (ECF subfamily)
MQPTERRRLHEHMTRLADGDRAAFAPVYETLWPILRAYCRRAVGDADGEDAAQQALCNVLARAGEFDAARDALAWAMGVATWECRTVRRRAWRRGETALGGELVAGLPDGGDGPEAALITRQLVRLAEEVVGTLAPGDAEVIAAAVSGDPGAAARQGLAPATFRKRVERAFARARAVWRSKHELP